MKIELAGLEISFESKEQTASFQGDQRPLITMIATLGVVLLLMILGFIGKPVTPYSSDGEATFLTWNDWQVYQGEKVYVRELTVLRQDADDLATLLNEMNPSPVEAQLVYERVKQDTAQGLSELEPARQALRAAALSVRDFTAGLADRSAAEADLRQAIRLLK